MKTSVARTAFLLLIIATSYSANAQNFDNIANAIRSGNSSAVAAGFQSNVEITIKDVGSSYSKSQAEMVLKNFFITYQPRSFSVVHQGASPEGAKYFIGNLTTIAGNFRVYVYAKTSGNSVSIQEMRFEEQ